MSELLHPMALGEIPDRTARLYRPRALGMMAETVMPAEGAEPGPAPAEAALPGVAPT